METKEKCKQLFDILNQHGHGIPTLEYTGAFDIERAIQFNQNNGTGHENEIALLTTTAQQVSTHLASALPPGKRYTNRQQALANHLKVHIATIGQYIDRMSNFTMWGLQPDKNDMLFLAKYNAATHEQLWLGYAIDACNALTYLYHNLEEEHAAAILAKPWGPGYSCTMEILQSFYDYSWICITRGCGDWSGTARPGGRLCLQGNKLKDTVDWSNHIVELEKVLEYIRKTWGVGHTLGQIVDTMGANWSTSGHYLPNQESVQRMGRLI